jgi:hypothetical protein
VTDATGTVVVSDNSPNEPLNADVEVASEEELTNPLHAEDDDPLSHVGEDVESFFEAHEEDK